MAERIVVTETATSSLRPAEPDLLEVDALSVVFPTGEGPVQAVTDVSFSVRPGEVLAIVGESGSGKSVTALAVMGLLPRSAQVSGEIRFKGNNLLPLGDKKMQAIRGNEIAMIFQDPMTALNPVFTIGDQIVEIIRAHHKEKGKEECWSRAVELLELVGVPEAKRRVRQYPHEFSGGMRQRALIAMSIANDPDLLIADEPTTALDVTIQAQVMDVMRMAQEATGAAMILITHDMGLVAGAADRVQVMYGGRVFEQGDIDDLFYASCNPYTRGLLQSIPTIGARSIERLSPIPGSPPSLLHPPKGCPFRPRCDMAIDLCYTVPTLVPVGVGHHVSRCHRASELDAELTDADRAGPAEVGGFAP